MRLVGWLRVVAALAVAAAALAAVPWWPGVRGQAIVAAEWPMLGRDALHSSWIPVAEAAGAINTTPAVAWRFTFDQLTEGWYAFHSQPLVVDLDRNGIVEVVAVDSAGRLVVLNGSNGARLVTVSVRELVASPHAVPLAVDLDGDGRLELVYGTRDGRVVALKVDPLAGTYTVYWSTPISLFPRVNGGPVAADVDGDGVPEVFVAGSGGAACVDGSTGLVQWLRRLGGAVLVASPVLVTAGGRLLLVYADIYGGVYALDARTGSVVWSTDLWQAYGLEDEGYIIHSPAAGDVDGDGAAEVVVGLARELFAVTAAGDWYKKGVTGVLAVLDAATGALESLVRVPDGAPAPWFSQPGLALADVDGDGAREIFAAGLDGVLYRIDCSAAGCSIAWSIVVDDTRQWWLGGSQADAPPVAASVAVADIDGDNGYEVIVASTRAVFTVGVGFTDFYYTVYSVNATTGAVEWSIDLTDYSYSVEGYYAKWSWPSLALGDIDSDGLIEPVVTVYAAVYGLDA